MKGLISINCASKHNYKISTKYHFISMTV